MEGEMEVRKRGRDESEEVESDVDSPEVKRLREDLLDSLDDENPEFCTSNQDLDSFMKSFEEEITASPSAAGAAACGGTGDGVTDVVDLVSEPDESRPDLGFLLEASDDELGIPPPPASPNDFKAELAAVESNSSDFGSEFWEGAGYDSFGFGFGFGEAEDYTGEYVALDGLFDYSDLGFGSGEVSWRPETLPAQ